MNQPQLRAAPVRQVRRVCLSLACTLGFVGLVDGSLQAFASDALVGGDFATLDGWELAKATEDLQRQIIPQNSPFTDVFPDNGSCFSASNSQMDVMRQNFSPISGKAIWSFDFLMKSSDPDSEAHAGHIVILLNGDERHSQVNVGRNARFNHFLSTDKETQWSTPKDFELAQDVWWHFSCEIDFENQTYNVTMRSEAGDSIESGPLDFPQDEEKDRSAVDGILIRGGGGGYTKSAGMYFDNISLRPAN
jgi:hypothetical protein